MLAELRAARPDRRLTLENAGDSWGEWDNDLLAQVIENLVSNAFEHGSADTPVVVSIRGQSAAVILEVVEPGTRYPGRGSRAYLRAVSLSSAPARR